MSNLTVQRTSNDKPAPTGAAGWEPFRTLRELMRFDPFTEMMPSLISEQGVFSPAFEVKETKHGIVFKADLPGVKESDLEVQLSNNRLSVSGKRESEKTDKGETYYAYERSFGSFSRSFALPEGVDKDKIKASLQNGVLTIELPSLPGAQPKKVAVTSG